MNDNVTLRLISNNSPPKNSFTLTLQELTNYHVKLLGSWELHQTAKGYTTETIALNLRNINEFMNLSGKFIWEIDKEDVEIFYAYLVGKNLAHSTRRKYQSNITTFLSYLRSRKQLEIYNTLGVTVPDVIDEFNKFYHRRDDSDVRVAPPRDEVIDTFFNGLIYQMEHGRKYSTAARDYVFFKILGMLGIRINELIMVDVGDVRFDLGEYGKIYIKYGKGSRGSGFKPRWIPLLNGSHELFQWYLDNVYNKFPINQTSKSPLFLSEKGTRISRDAMRGNLRRRQSSFGIPKEEMFSAHQLRHFFATKMKESGLDILTLSKLLGHSNIATTAAYVQASDTFIEQRIRIAQKKWNEEVKGLGGKDDG